MAKMDMESRQAELETLVRASLALPPELKLTTRIPFPACRSAH